jgi:hypothetical protein
LECKELKPKGNTISAILKSNDGRRQAKPTGDRKDAGQTEKEFIFRKPDHDMGNMRQEYRC